MGYSSLDPRVHVRVAEVSRDEETGLYTATLDLSYEDRSYGVRVSNLIRAPHRARARVEGDYLVVTLDDSEGKPLSTCCIHVKHIECGCMECRSLITPPCPQREQ
ncbi:MAG: hypothetical protein QXS85_06170 [Acidilobaceae archaeon]